MDSKYFFDTLEDSSAGFSWKDHLYEKLVRQNGYVDLSTMSSVISKAQFYMRGDIKGAREATLSYLLPLLQEGKLRVMKVTQPSLGEEFGHLHYDDPEKAIDDMRSDWKKAELDTSLTSAVELAYLFTLPENKFPGEE